MSVGLSVMSGRTDWVARMAGMRRMMRRHAWHVFHVVQIPMMLRNRGRGRDGGRKAGGGGALIRHACLIFAIDWAEKGLQPLEYVDARILYK